MLVIRRKTGQTVQVGAEVSIEILEITPNRVKLGVRAPAAVRVLRGEMAVAEAENMRAVRVPPAGVLSEWARNLMRFAPR